MKSCNVRRAGTHSASNPNAPLATAALVPLVLNRANSRDFPPSPANAFGSSPCLPYDILFEHRTVGGFYCVDPTETARCILHNFGFVHVERAAHPAFISSNTRF